MAIVKDSTTEIQKYSLDIREELLKALHYEKKLFFTIGRMLKEIRDRKLYEQMGDGGNESFQQFLASPEINITQPRAYFYIRVFEFYIEKMKFQEEELEELSAYKLFRLLPLVKGMGKKEVVEVINEMKPLGVGDTERTIDEKRGRIAKPSVVFCKSCGKYAVKYRQKEICQCEGFFHLVNLDI